MQAKLLLVAVIVAFVVAVLPSTCEAQGKKPPLIPTEYAANVVQRKWNYNGFGVNNTYNMVMYISRSQMKWRTDTVLAGNCANNRSEPFVLNSMQAISLLDFSVKPAVNTYTGNSNIAAKPSCATGPTGYPPPPPANFLALVHAIYAGQMFLPEYSAMCDRWVVPTKGSVSFYFISKTQQFVRWDMQVYDNSPGGQQEVGVVTNYFNLVETNITQSIFAGSGHCPSWTVPPYDTCANATFKSLHDLDDWSSPAFVPFHYLIPHPAN